MKLSVIMAVYNEAKTLQEATKRVLDVDFPCEIELIVVDDGSTDGSAEVMDRLHDRRLVKVAHSSNQGKGAALRTAAQWASGDFVVSCDADLEYSPNDLLSLLVPVIAGDAQVVFGTRSFGSNTAYSFWYVMGNKIVTMAANLLYNCWLSDLETCFKLMPLPLYRALRLREQGFGVEAEITGKLLRAGIRPFEVPIRYKARSREDGKKLTWRDGVKALAILLQLRLAKPPVLSGISI
jgi:glycosyltransferase involved in cell wall biosynthesis